VRQQSGLTSTWDSTEQAWIVEANVTAMKTGVIRVTPNAGIYANTNEFYEYMSTLLGATMPNQLSIDGVLFPPIILDQKGVSHRLNETTERWDLLQTRNLIFDMMLAPDGSVTIDGVQLEVFTSGVTCAGTDPKSYDEQQDGPLLAAQCSVAKTIGESVQMTNRNKGVCTNSTAQYVNHYVYPKTKDGSYSTAEAQCQF
jgi:hypothetical protein